MKAKCEPLPGMPEQLAGLFIFLFRVQNPAKVDIETNRHPLLQGALGIFVHFIAKFA